MLSTFTIGPDKNLVIPSGDIRAIRDESTNTSVLTWQCGTEICRDRIQGTATENRIRLQQEELDAMGRIAAHQRQFSQPPQMQMPPMPVVRGKAGRR